MRLELDNGERVLPIGLRSLLARLNGVNFSSILRFLTLTARKRGLDSVGNHAMTDGKGPRCKLGGIRHGNGRHRNCHGRVRGMGVVYSVYISIYI